MIIKTVIVKESAEETVSEIFVNGLSYGFVLEDQHRGIKVAADTRIPRGIYEIKFRTVGGFHTKYKNRYAFHKGMLQLMNVPGFDFILIHIGNTDEDTAGCLLTGLTWMQTKGNRLIVQRSADAYVKLYPVVAAELSAGHKVFIHHGV